MWHARIRTFIPKERKPNAIGQRPRMNGNHSKRILSNGGLVDIGRALDPDNDQLFTWWPPVARHASEKHRLAAGLYIGRSIRRRRA